MIPHNQIVPTPEEMCDRILCTEEEINKRIAELAIELYGYYQNLNIYHIHSITVLMGASRISTLLLNNIELINKINPDKPPIVIHEDSVLISSYGKEFRTNKDPRIILPPQFSTFKHNILIIEDIVDSGLTMSYFLNDINFASKKPASVKLLTLIDKPVGRCDIAKNLKPDFVGFTINKKLFLVGFGLDYKHYYRNLPYIMCIKKEYQK